VLRINVAKPRVLGRPEPHPEFRFAQHELMKLMDRIGLDNLPRNVSWDREDVRPGYFRLRFFDDHGATLHLSNEYPAGPLTREEVRQLLG
jgi:hypothetical protein